MKIGLEWVNYQIFRRTCATLLNTFPTVDGSIVASQLGHGLDVSQNVYKKIGLQRQRDAVNTLDQAINKKKTEKK